MKIVVLTCDSYNWMLPVFFHFYEKAWQKNPYETDVITEHEEVSFGDSTFYTRGKSWGSGMLDYIRQSQASKFMFILDDYIIKSVDVERARAAERLCSGNIGCVRLSNDPHRYFEKHTKDSPVIEGFRKYPNDQRFCSAIQISIYQREYLLDIFKDNESIWEAEKEAVGRIRKLASKWQIFWPEENIFEYNSIGLMRKGILRPQVLRWAKSKVSEDSNVYKILECQIKIQKERQ